MIDYDNKCIADLGWAGRILRKRQLQTIVYSAKNILSIRQIEKVKGLLFRDLVIDFRGSGVRSTPCVVFQNDLHYHGKFVRWVQQKLQMHSHLSK